MTNQASAGTQRVSGLPFSHGRSFATLDEYLAHLRDFAGPVGQPWYRGVGPGAYELVATLQPAPAPERVSREELMRRFGFAGPGAALLDSAATGLGTEWPTPKTETNVSP